MQNQVNSNLVFERLWTTASESRYLKKAKNENGAKVLKGMMWNRIKFIVKPSSTSDGFIVKLIKFPDQFPTIDQNGIIQFPRALNTQNAIIFYLELRRWFEAYCTIFGELNAFYVDSHDFEDGSQVSENDLDIDEAGSENND